MWGGYFGLLGTIVLSLPLWVSMCFSLVAMAGLGFLYNQFAYYPMRNRPPVTVIIASIGMSILLRNSALAAWGPDPLKLGSFLGDEIINFCGIIIPRHQLIIYTVTMMIFIGQYFFFAKTSLGRKLEATAQDQEMAKLMGIKVNRMIILTFILATCLASIAGFLMAPLWFLEPNVGLYIIVKAFIAIVIGGFGSIPGLVIGGLFLGVIEVLVASHLTSEYKDVISFLILITMLLLLPQGFFGEKIAEKV
jgi:branched-chain amino acid transport system permease protein